MSTSELRALIDTMTFVALDDPLNMPMFRKCEAALRELLAIREAIIPLDHADVVERMEG